MAYEKHTWSCGETVTADLLNHMEEGIEDADPGYSCTYTDETVIDETFTSEDSGASAYAELQSETKVSAESVIIIYDGVRYTCPNLQFDGIHGAYGADFNGEELVFTDYPFRFVSPNEIHTETAGEHTIQVIVSEPSATYTECFKKAVQTVVEESGGGSDNTNLVNGSSISSLRTISSAPEGDGYKIGDSAFATGIQTKAIGPMSHTEGLSTTASGAFSHVEGRMSTASDSAAHAEGQETTASGTSAHAEGENTKATALAAHAEGRNSIASDSFAHAEGDSTESKGNATHAEGIDTEASNYATHAEGHQTISSGLASHAEGENTTSSGYTSHAEGNGTTASGSYSHAEGNGTVSKHVSQHVFGSYNEEDPSTAGVTEKGTYLEIVGNGTSSARSNARTLDWDGNEKLAGGLTLGLGTADEVTISAAQLKALLATLS